MTSNASSIEVIYHSPPDLIAFYRHLKQKPTVEIIKNNCIRYEYDASEIKQICDAFEVNVSDYRAIRNEVYDSINPIAQVLKEKDKLMDGDRVDAAWKHIQDLHYRSECYGNIIFGCPRITKHGKKSMWQYAVPKSKLTRTMVARMLLVPNLYIMVNTSKSYARKSEQVVSVNALYLDIDNVKDVEGFVTNCRDKGLFDVVEPSKIISSGGGVHMYFYLENAYAKTTLVPYIRRMQKALHVIYPKADKLSDLVRFLRLDGSTYNKPRKALKTVSTVFESDRVYTVSEIGEVLVKPYEKREKTKRSRLKEDNPFVVVPSGSWKDLEVKRVRDMEYLFKIGHFKKDRRKRALFFYGLFLLRASSLDNAVTGVYEMNSSFEFPLERDEVENQLSSIKQNGYKYKYKRETLFKQLEIDQLPREQQEGLRTMMPDEIKYMRQLKQKKLLRRNEKGLTRRQAKTEDNYNKVRSLLEQGFKQKDIAIKLSITKGYVSKIVKQIKNKNK